MKSIAKQTLLWGGGLALLILIVLKLAGTFDEKIAPGPGSAIASKPVSGKNVDVVEIEEPVVERYPGSVGAVREAVISARLIARVRQILVRSGQRIAKGEPLVV
ncbi:MAG: hypothetical protein ACYTEG_10655, partial [Planctomycetota bacterium]